MTEPQREQIEAVIEKHLDMAETDEARRQYITDVREFVKEIALGRRQESDP